MEFSKEKCAKGSSGSSTIAFLRVFFRYGIDFLAQQHARREQVPRRRSHPALEIFRAKAFRACE